MAAHKSLHPLARTSAPTEICCDGGSASFSTRPVGVQDTFSIWATASFRELQRATHSDSEKTAAMFDELAEHAATLMDTAMNSISRQVDAINANVTSGSTAMLTLLNTAGNRSGFDGFVANVNNANFTTSFTNSNIDSSGRNGMNFNVANGGTLVSTFDVSSFNNNAASGIFHCGNRDDV